MPARQQLGAAEPALQRLLVPLQTERKPIFQTSRQRKSLKRVEIDLD
jgi:hypothetical protein